MMVEPKTLERFYDKVLFTSDCWEWIGNKIKSGYGYFYLNGKMVRAHRLSYQLSKGDIPQGLDLDHLCRVRHCVNPEHLEPVTRKENANRGDSGKIGAQLQKSKTYCPKGHEYTKENTRIYRNKRFCKECMKDYNKNYGVKV